MDIERVVLVAVAVALTSAAARAQRCAVPSHVKLDWLGADTVCTRDGVNPCAALEPITFTASGGGGIPACAGYQWDFGDGATSTLASPAHAYATSANYEITLRVTGLDGDATEATSTVSVAPPGTCTLPNKVRIEWKGKHTGCKNDHGKPCAVAEPIAFSALGVGGVIPPCAAHSWNFGDGSGTTAIRAPQHRYDVKETFDVSLEVAGSGGQVLTAAAPITILTVLPSLLFTASSTSVCLGEPVGLTWTAQNAISIALEGVAADLLPIAPDTLPLNGWLTFHPQTTATYVLTARGDAGQRSEEVTVEVAALCPRRRPVEH